MSNTFIRDLSIDPRARQARQQQALETSALARQTAAFRPTMQQVGGAETGFVTGVVINGPLQFAVPVTGMYLCMCHLDTETAPAGAFVVMTMRVNGGVVATGLNATAGGNRQNIAMQWGGLIPAGQLVNVWGEATAFSKCYGGTLTVMRVA